MQYTEIRRLEKAVQDRLEAHDCDGDIYQQNLPLGNWDQSWKIQSIIVDIPKHLRAGHLGEVCKRMVRSGVLTSKPVEQYRGTSVRIQRRGGRRR